MKLPLMMCVHLNCRMVATTFLVYVNVITDEGLIEESVVRLQSRLLLHCEAKGGERIYLGEEDEMYLPLSVVYDGDSSIHAAVTASSGGIQLEVTDPKDVVVMAHSGSQTSLELKVES